MKNKTILIILAVFLGIFLIFGAMAALFARSFSFSSIERDIDIEDFFFSFGSKGDYFEVNQDETSDITGIDEIYIDAVSVDIAFENSDSSDNVDINLDCEGYTRNEPVKLIVKKEGRRLIVQMKYDRRIGVNLVNGLLSIKIPEGYDEDITINTVSSEVYTEDKLSNDIDEFDIDTVSGNVDVNCMSIADLKYNTTSGELDVFSSIKESVDVDTVSGDIYIYKILSSVETIVIDSVSGNIDLYYEEPCQTKIDTVSGDVTISFETSKPVNLDFDAMSGKMTGNITLEDSGVEMTIDSVSGDLQFK